MRLFVAFFVAALTMVACASERVTGSQSNDLSNVVAAVDLKAGITQVQASAIAEWYFQHYISGCGAVTEVSDKGDVWELTPLIGYAATPDPNPIIISKHSGEVSWKGGPAFETTGQMLNKQP